MNAGDSLFAVLADRTYRHLFLAQIVALVGTGLTTVALGLLAYDLAGKDAGAVLGTALAIKMVAYVMIAPIAGAYANRLPRRTLLVTLDLARLAVVIVLPFVSQIWQIYVLIFVLQSCSAAFTPTFQATIPEVLPAERDYTKALSLSRLAYDLETLLSPALAALLLLVVSYQALFIGTAFGFLGSALLVVSVVLPRALVPASQTTIREKLTRGVRIYLLTPRLRGLLALNLAAAAGSAMVIVNTAVIVRSELGHSDRAVALALAAFGAGSMTMAFCLPRILRSWSDRIVMMTGGVALTFVLALQGALWLSLPSSSRWPMLLLAWLGLGAAYATLVTPGGRLLRRSSHEEDRPALFAAQFSLSHACWLIAYPLVGWLGARVGTAPALLAMTGLAATGVFAAAFAWPRHDKEILGHRHDDLPPDHPHLRDSGHEHAHAYVIDDLHVRWPA
jgi:predicted MFS family arabinose efflux permease